VLAGGRQDGFRLAAADWNAVQADVAALLHREIQRAPVRRPLRRLLPVVDRASHLSAAAAVRVHHPHVRVLHRRFGGGERPLGTEIGNRPAVGRPDRLVLGGLRLGEPADRAVGHADEEDVVVEETVRIGLAVRDEQDRVAPRRPVDRVLVEAAVGELPHLERA
jgi:hypothetical protein